MKRTSKEEYHYLYRTKRWTGTAKRKQTDGLRFQTFLRDGFRCVHCGVMVTAKHPAPNSPVCNHIVRHEGSEELFYDPANLETCCRSCHDSTIQSMEKGGKMLRDDGWRP